MTHEEKGLLLKDLCGRLPYGVKVAIEYSKGKYTHIYDLREINNDTTSELRQQVTIWNYGFYNSVISYPLIDCRPYLRPMSSMTEKEEEEYAKYYIGTNRVWIRDKWIYFDNYNELEYLNKKMFDYRGLIEKGLAIAVIKENNPYENNNQKTI